MNAFVYPASVGEQTIADLIASNNEQRLRARREADTRATLLQAHCMGDHIKGYMDPDCPACREAALRKDGRSMFGGTLRAGGAARSTNSGSSTAAHRESESLSERGTTLAPKAASSALGRGFWFSVGALIALAVVLSWRV